MNKKRILTILAIVVLFAIVTVGIVSADDGAMFRRNVSKTPDQETERANLMQMTFYVPAQNSLGELIPIEYYDAADVLVDTRDNAKPLVAVYIDALPEDEHEEGLAGILSGASYGAHDAYAAVSLDDGDTWKRTNLSNSADLSSFLLANGHEYPGDAHNMTLALAGDKVLVGWISKYCDGGSPAYTWVDDTTGEDIYPDIWGVAGSQGSVDYSLQGFEDVGEIPYSCVWSARGTLLEVNSDGVPTEGGGFYDIIWTKAERLTSGRRDANRLEMNGDSAAGFMMTWQEDPQGLRPGQGLGPGEGWSGAVVNQQTDLWYSSISIEDFEMVQTNDTDDTAISIYNYADDSMPKIAAPMALPVRLTDNAMCKILNDDPYCYIDFDDIDTDGNLILPDDLPTMGDAESDFCTTQVSWLNPGGETLDLCVAEDGRVMQGRVGASRPRVNVQPYDADGDGVYDSAWVIMGAEESKALGEGMPEDTGGGQPEETDLEDVGKNMWYYSFDMLNPEVVMQGGMLNQPAIDPETLTFFELLEDDFGNRFYETEISRRFSHFSQPIHQIGDAGVSAVLIVKQGIINQGGPADIFLRRIVVPPDFYYEIQQDDITVVVTATQAIITGTVTLTDTISLGNQVVELYDIDNTLVASDTTGIDGSFFFDVPADTYTVTTEYLGAVESVVGDPSTISPVLFDFDEIDSPAIVGQIWFDGNQDLNKQDHEVMAPVGTTVTITSTSPITYEATTSNTGYYYFDGLYTEEYTISATIPDAYEFTVTPGATVTLGDELLFGNDFGLFNDELSTLTGTITSTTGVVPGLPLNLWLDDLIVATAITDSAGEYLFDGLPPGVYAIEIAAPGYEEISISVTAPLPGFDSSVDNPYAFENMACDEWAYTDGSNPRYLQGLCLSNMINVSGGTIVACDGTVGDCADQFPWDGVEEGDSFPKVTEWVQTADNLDDQSWENPYDVAKGHRGFIDGDFIMMMYAWSPNWQANSVGNDHYNLYARRSFDGGATWTTTPAELGGVGETGNGDDPTVCENYKNGTDINTVCSSYGAGEFEQARNLSQLIGNRETILDPRYTPTGGIKMLPITDLKEIGFTGYDDDVRDPSRFFIVYETGDNTTVAEGEAVPMDLFYSRATAWGDDYDLEEYYNQGTGETTLGFDWLEHDREDLSGEAANLANNGGTYYYAIWNQWQEDEYENISESDSIFRRIMYLDDADEGDEDAAPIVSILYVSSMMPHVDDQLLIIGTARDGDHVGLPPFEDIGETEWTDTYMGITQVIEDDDGDPKRLNIPAGNLHPGWHGIGFKASDKGGRWSPGVTVNIVVNDGTNVVFLPLALP